MRILTFGRCPLWNVLRNAVLMAKKSVFAPPKGCFRHPEGSFLAILCINLTLFELLNRS